MRRSNWKVKILALIGILAGILAGGAAAWAAWKYAVHSMWDLHFLQ